MALATLQNWIANNQKWYSYVATMVVSYVTTTVAMYV